MKQIWRNFTRRQKVFVIGLGLIILFLLSASVSYSYHNLVLLTQRTALIEHQMALLDTLKAQHQASIRFLEDQILLKDQEIQKRELRIDSIQEKYAHLQRQKHDVPQVIADMDSTQLLEQFRGILSDHR